MKSGHPRSPAEYSEIADQSAARGRPHRPRAQALKTEHISSGHRAGYKVSKSAGEDGRLIKNRHFEERGEIFGRYFGAAGIEDIDKNG
jgi:hypothetical protein